MFLLDKGVPGDECPLWGEEKCTKPWIGEGISGSSGLNDGSGSRWEGIHAFVSVGCGVQYHRSVGCIVPYPVILLHPRRRALRRSSIQRILFEGEIPDTRLKISNILEKYPCSPGLAKIPFKSLSFTHPSSSSSINWNASLIAVSAAHGTTMILQMARVVHATFGLA